MVSPVLVVHITGGLIGIFSGAAAISLRKGSSRHAVAGKIFVAAMLTMSTAAVYLATTRRETPNIIAGVLTFYLITTAWLTARRHANERNPLDWAVLLIPLAGASWGWFNGLVKVFGSTPPDDGVPTVMNFVVASVMSLAAAGDIRMLLRGIAGTKRLVRHLWRMCFGLFIATGSFFLGQQQVFPRAVRGSALLLILGIFPLFVLLFWFIRVRFTRYASRLYGSASPLFSG